MIRIHFMFPGGPEQLGGAERQALLYLERADRHRFDPTLVLLGKNRAIALGARALGVPVVLITGARLGHPWLELRRHWLSSHPLVVHVFGMRADLAARITSMGLRDVRIVSAIRGVESHRSRIQRRLAAITAPRVAMWLSNSAAGLEAAIQHEGAVRDRSVVVANGLPRTHVDEVERAAWRTGIRSALGIRPDESIVVQVANHRPLKRQTDLVRAVAEAHDGGTRLHALMVGQVNEYTNEVTALARQLGVLDLVHCVGFADDVRPYLAASDVQVLLSTEEGLPNCLLEGMAMGLPIVATRVGAVPELVRDGVNGRLIEVGEVSRLRSILEEIIGAGAPSNWGANGMKTVASQYSVEAMVEGWSTAFESAARDA